MISCRSACAKHPGFKFGGWQIAATIAVQLKHCARVFIAHTVAAMHPRTAGHLCLTSAFFWGAHAPPRRDRAFTLIELLVVIAIIAILIGLLFPAFKAVQNQAKATQAKNDLTQIVNAVNAFYTEYGKYPLVTNDTTYGSSTSNRSLFDVLRAADLINNPRQIVFISPPDVKDPNNPRSGIGTAAANVGQYFDPWGTPYKARIDGTYDNQIANPYSLHAGAPNLQIGVIAWSFGTDTQSQSLPGPAADKNTGTNSDDVISWQ